MKIYAPKPLKFKGGQIAVCSLQGEEGLAHFNKASEQDYPSNMQPFLAPCVMLQHTVHGVVTFQNGTHDLKLESGDFYLVRKYSHGKIHKTFSLHENAFEGYIFMFDDNYIQEFFRKHNFPTTKHVRYDSPIVKLKPSPILHGFIASLKEYEKKNLEISPELLSLKTEEALLGIISVNPEMKYIFTEQIARKIPDLITFMRCNYLFDYSLEQFAEQSGRSLSKFNRDFREVFKQTPQRWLMSQRLHMAKNLLSEPNQTPSDVYHQVGFKTSAHFSRKFKEEFGITPTDFQQQTHNNN